MAANITSYRQLPEVVCFDNAMVSNSEHSHWILPASLHACWLRTLNWLMTFVCFEKESAIWTIEQSIFVEYGTANCSIKVADEVNLQQLPHKLQDVRSVHGQLKTLVTSANIRCSQPREVGLRLVNAGIIHQLGETLNST